MNEILIGGIAVASFVAGLFFLRFWRATGDRFFLFFVAAFWLEGAHRAFVYQLAGSDESAPYYYLIRLIAYGLIIAAIIGKNRGKR